jgi:hypothetical protein
MKTPSSSPVIVRRSPVEKDCFEVFYADAPANPGHIMCRGVRLHRDNTGTVYSGSEASWEYYRECRKNPTPTDRVAVLSAIRHVTGESCRPAFRMSRKRLMEIWGWAK